MAFGTPGKTGPNVRLLPARTTIGCCTAADTLMLALFWACAATAPAVTSASAMIVTFVAVYICLYPLLWRQIAHCHVTFAERLLVQLQPHNGNARRIPDP